MHGVLRDVLNSNDVAIKRVQTCIWLENTSLSSFSQELVDFRPLWMGRMDGHDWRKDGHGWDV